MGRVDRYQGLKLVPIGTSPGEQVHILHAPSFDLYGVDRRIAGTPFLWTLDATAAGLKRSQPDFISSGIVRRFDMRPELSLPLHFGGWSVLGSVAARETFYSRSRETPYSAGAAPVQLTQPLNRAEAEMKVEVRPPTLERNFAVPLKLQKFFGTELRHTIEPEVTYRDVRGVDNFLSVLRFDESDLVSDNQPDGIRGDAASVLPSQAQIGPPSAARLPRAGNRRSVTPRERGCESAQPGGSEAAHAGRLRRDPGKHGRDRGGDTGCPHTVPGR